MVIKIGHGYDVHKLVDNKDFILCGVKIDYEKGLLGYSDGDVAFHAIIDSMLGAAGLNDIGNYFPDNDQQYKNIDSKKLLIKTLEIIKSKGYNIGNIDCTIILQNPKIKKYIERMKKTVSEILDIGYDQFNVKATTEEGLGFTGNGLGVAAHAVVLLMKGEF